jgi:hypothetical protein
MTEILTIETHSLFEGYALQLAADFLGTELRSEARGVISRGPGPRQIPSVEGYTRASVPKIPDEDLFASVRVPGAPFPFDLFSAIRFWIADEGNTDGGSAWDEHDRLIRAGSAQMECGVAETPIINEYLKLFRAWIETQFDRSLSPRPARIVLTHDVDEPIDPTNIRHPLWLMGAALAAGKPRASVGHLRRLPQRIWSRLTGQKSQHWNFEEIVDLEASHGARSAFYFAATPWWAQGASDYDVSYDVRAPQFRKMMKSLQSSGAEVGLHLSYNARDNLELLVRERARLEAACGSEVLGGRHHYWHMKRPFWDTLRQHERAGLAYDTSVGFNEAPGYRLGIAHPFRPWDPDKKAVINVLQIPTMLMDGALLYDQEVSETEAIRRAKKLIRALIASEGTAAIDWHVRTSWPGSSRFARWARVYAEILSFLAAEPDVTVCTPSQILATAPLAGH